MASCRPGVDEPRGGHGKAFSDAAGGHLFADAGLHLLQLISLGALQVAGGIFAIPRIWRRQGLWLMALGFLASSVVILMTGNMAFAVGALLPVILALYLSLPPDRTTD